MSKSPNRWTSSSSASPASDASGAVARAEAPRHAALAISSKCAFFTGKRARCHRSATPSASRTSDGTRSGAASFARRSASSDKSPPRTHAGSDAAPSSISASNSRRHCARARGSSSTDGSLGNSCRSAPKSGARTARDNSRPVSASTGSPLAIATASRNSVLFAPYLPTCQHRPGRSPRPARPATCAASQTYRSLLTWPSNLRVSAKTTSSSGKLMPWPITSVQTSTSSRPARAASSCARRASGGSFPKTTDALAPAFWAAAASDSTAALEKATNATNRPSLRVVARNPLRSTMGCASKCKRDRRCVLWTLTSAAPSKTFVKSGRASAGPQMRTWRYRPALAANNKRVHAWPLHGSTHQWTSSNTNTSPPAGATSAVQQRIGASASSDSSPVHSPTRGATSPHDSAARAATASRVSQASARSGPA
mmetsp:Transcript_6221/g.19636  ORF Transcript_6221/g.19636 Transcript_6221/m.19636 type:complete len:425 (+) Transcript_6221:391-1665(+)